MDVIFSENLIQSIKITYNINKKITEDYTKFLKGTNLYFNEISEQKHMLILEHTIMSIASKFAKRLKYSTARLFKQYFSNVQTIKTQ